MSAENSSKSLQLDDSEDYDTSVSCVSSDLSRRASAPVYLSPDVQCLDPDPDADVDDQAIPVQGSMFYTRLKDAAGLSQVPTPGFANAAAFERSFERSSDASSELFYTSFAEPLSLLEARARSLNFSKPPTHDVIKRIILRSRRDNGSLPMDLDDDVTDSFPPTTGIEKVDELSRGYYNLTPTDSPLREIGSPLSYVYPIRVVLGVQRDLRDPKLVIFPPPIPICILSPLDYVGPSRIVQGEDSWAFIVPSKMTIWKAVLKRGVDKHYRPLNHDPATGQPRKVLVERCRVGRATYSVRSQVTSQLAVNLFLQLPSPHPYRLTEIQVEYLGMYVMRHIDNIKMTPESLRMVSDEDMNRIYHDLSPSLSTASEPNMQFPFVMFSYIRFDDHLIGAIDRAAQKSNTNESVARLRRDIVEGVVDNSLNQQDATWDWTPAEDDGDGANRGDKNYADLDAEDDDNDAGSDDDYSDVHLSAVRSQ
ncbi:hypothetical protein EDD16DRAFT_686071 [Pisolithus croceorrhizus]|nr:hypothetical protein EDD16DRAFT_686071 [Pisolithus croceorrhizus]